MPIYKVKLKAREEIAAGTMAFHFEKPEGFVYKAGQFADYTLINPPETDAEGNTRGFSLASAPYEDDLMSATRMRDTAFKRVLKTMPLGTELTLDAPYGSFTLHNNAAIPAVFVTGGIGVTPVRSIVLQAIHDQVAHRIYRRRFQQKAGGCGLPERLEQATREKPALHLCRHDDSDGKIKPGVARGNRTHDQSDAFEIHR